MRSLSAPFGTAFERTGHTSSLTPTRASTVVGGRRRRVRPRIDARASSSNTRRPIPSSPHSSAVASGVHGRQPDAAARGPGRTLQWHRDSRRAHVFDIAIYGLSVAVPTT
jgi:hypothetical protein